MPIKLSHILFSLLFSTLLFSQSNHTHSILEDIEGISKDSAFILVDDYLYELDSAKASDDVILEILRVKLEIADTSNDRIREQYAIESILDYKHLISQEELYDFLTRGGNLQAKSGNFDRAMELHFEAVTIAEELQNDTLLARIYRRIGINYKNARSPELAIKYLNDSKTIFTHLGDTVGMVNCDMTIGNAYKAKAVYDTALIYYNNSLVLAEKIGMRAGMSGNYNNIGNVYRQQGKLKESLDFFFLALEINLEDDNKSWVSYNYNNIGNTYKEMEQYSTARLYFDKSLEIKNETGDEAGKIATLDNLGEISAKLGEYKTGYEFLRQATQLRESFENSERMLFAAELEAKFQNEKKEAEINQLKAEQSLQDLVIESQQKDIDHQNEVRSKNRILFVAMGFIVLILIGAVIVFWRNNQHRKKYNIKLKQKNREIQQINAEINEARAHLIEKNQEVTDSITYAKRIQAAMLPSQKILKANLNDAFVFYLPKDIVAGDFYWTEKIEDTTLFAVADCTGHGVPGAMVSVVCHNALNTAMKQISELDPGKILDETRSLVIKQFEQSEENVLDGMDIALCAYNHKTNRLLYSGANIPLWKCSNGELEKIKSTRQPVGKSGSQKQFETVEISVSEGDYIYLSSDGYTDQFGSDDSGNTKQGGKKFLFKRFRKLLVSLNQLPIEDQHENVRQTFFDWKKDFEQVDDICLMGIKL